MKKFLVLSAIVGLAGIGVGVARQQEPAAVEAATVDATSSTTVTTIPPVATSSPTTVRKTAVKATSTPTTVRRVSTPTTMTTAQVAATPPTTVVPVAAVIANPTTTTTRFKATCKLGTESPTVGPGKAQVIRITSNMPNVKAQIRYGSKTSEWIQLDAGGAGNWQIAAPAASGPVSVTTSFMFAPGQFVGSICSTSFMVA